MATVTIAAPSATAIVLAFLNQAGGKLVSCRSPSPVAHCVPHFSWHFYMFAIQVAQEYSSTVPSCNLSLASEVMR
ncbi:hypothetical protein BGW80DRAFT_1291546, partial [Lactifluus volemus]